MTGFKVKVVTNPLYQSYRKIELQSRKTTVFKEIDDDDVDFEILQR